MEGKRLLQQEVWTDVISKEKLSVATIGVVRSMRISGLSDQSSLVGKQFTQSYDLYTPKGESNKSTKCQVMSHSRGNGTDSMMQCQIEQLNGQIQQRLSRPFVRLSKGRSKQNNIEEAKCNAVLAAANAALVSNSDQNSEEF